MDDAERLAALLRSLTNITPTAGQVDRIELLRDKAKMFGQAVIESCPDSRERSLGLTHLEETVMWAVKSIVVEVA